MNNRRVVCSSWLALILPALLGLSCLRRNWDVCASNAPCKPGYTCTADWRCVLTTDAGSDGLAVDSQVSTDAIGGMDGLVAITDGAVGPAGGQDARELDSAPTFAAPDGPVSAAPDGLAAGREAPAMVPDAPVTVPDVLAAVPDGQPPMIPDTPPIVPDTAASLPDTRPVGSSPDAATPDAAPSADAPGSCSTDRDCPSQKPLCLANQCAKCTADSDCAGRSGTLACAAASGLCVACTENRHCTGVASTCDTATNQCVGCVTRDDCAGACHACSSGGVCTAVRNQDDPGRCPGTCDNTGACKSKQGQTCLTVASGCAAGTTCSPDGVCCDGACGQTCHSCLGSKTGGRDGTCATVSDGTSCGASGQYCTAGTCTSGCLISGTVYANGATNPSSPCQACQSSSPTSWSSLGNGRGCGGSGSGKVCRDGTCQAGCWISGSFVGSGATESGNTCLVCNPAKSTSGWSNNDAATAVPCGSCGGTATCASGALGPCSKTTTTYYQDNDGDGYGSPLIPPVVACIAPTGWVAQGGDCDDHDAQDYPGAAMCSTSDPNTVTTCSSSGSLVSTTCANGCAGGQCRSLATIGVAGLVTCGSLQCQTSQGCSFGNGWGGGAVCGATLRYYSATCDGPNDCPSGQVCCYGVSGGHDAGVHCVPNDGSCPRFQAGSNYYLVCDPNQPACPAGSSCKMLSPYSAYTCQPN
jgi:hypothetical protein